MKYNEHIRDIELKRQNIINSGNQLCLECSGTGIIGYSVVVEPSEVKCDKCNGKGFSDA